jgi:hypothetical protein
VFAADISQNPYIIIRLAVFAQKFCASLHHLITPDTYSATIQEGSSNLAFQDGQFWLLIKINRGCSYQCELG